MDIATTFWFFDKIKDDKLCLLYNGSFNDDMTSRFIELSEYNIDNNEGLQRMKNKISYMMAECFQNIVRHGEVKKEGEEEVEEQLPGFFSTKNTRQTYFITTGNLIIKENIEKLEGQLKQVNTLNKEELKKLYIHVIANNKLSSKGGAGLGLIEMARKSGHKIEYSFDNYDDEFSFFYSQIKLAKEREIEFPLDESIKFHKKMNEENVLLIQKGDFSQESILPVLKIIEQNLLKNKKATKQNKSVYHVLVELLQNIGKHGLLVNNHHDGIFLIQQKGPNYIITAGNYIEHAKVADLKKKLTIVKNANEDELEEMYMAGLIGGGENINDYVGLGLISIGKESKKPINFNFHETDSEKVFFTFQVTV